jgi:hypothetical protein
LSDNVPRTSTGIPKDITKLSYQRFNKSLTIQSNQMTSTPAKIISRPIFTYKYPCRSKPQDLFS